MTNKQLYEELMKMQKDMKLIKKAMKDIDITIKLDDEDLKTISIGVVGRMVKLKAMEDWFNHVSKSEAAWSTAYKDLELTEEENALGEAAKLMTLMNLFQEDEEYEKCAVIKQRMDEVNRILKKGKK